MSPPADLAGRRFGSLVALRPAGRNKFRYVTWLCRCDCGTEVVVSSNELKFRNVQSCGCWKHGHCSGGVTSRTYHSWRAMMARCENPKDPCWKHYGGRGISVCESWHTFKTFLADMGERPPGLTLDRINNDGNYEPGNCRWATWRQQALNKRTSRRRAA